MPFIRARPEAASTALLDDVVDWSVVAGLSVCFAERRDPRVALVDLRRGVDLSSVVACSWLLEVSERLFSGVRSCSGKSTAIVSSTCTSAAWLGPGAVTGTGTGTVVVDATDNLVCTSMLGLIVEIACAGCDPANPGVWA